MTKKQIKQKADMYINDFNDTELSEIDLILFAEQLVSETTKELEKENAELKQINSETLAQLNLDNGELIIENEKLKKENAELKAELEAIDKAGEHVRQQITDAFRNKKPYWELEKENIEAKEIIKELLNSCFGYNSKTVNYEVKAKAEAFLKE